MDKVTASTSPTELGTRSIRRLLVQYSIPAIVASVATSLYNIVDSIFIGHGVGALAISALAIAFPLMNLIIGFCMLVAAGGAAISSIFLGQKNYVNATKVLNNVTLCCLVHSVVVGGLSLIWLDDILRLFGATEQILPDARDFMFVILLGSPLSFVFIGLNFVMRATGYPSKAMMSALISVVVNAAVAPIMIFVLHWGMYGAAMATLVGQAAGLVWVLSHFLSKKSFVHYTRGLGWLDFEILKKIYAIGLSPFLMNMCACVVVIFINKAILEYAGADGNIGVGAYGIINRTTMFFVMIVFGVTQGMQPILGYNYGAANWPRVMRTLKLGIYVGLAITTVGFAVTELFPDAISAMFTTDTQMVDIARKAFRIYFMFFPLVGVQIVIQNFFQSIGKPKLSIFLSLTRQLIFLLPALWILSPIFRLDGVWGAMATSDFLAFVLTLVTVIVATRREKRRFEHTLQTNLLQ
ncbi:MAG: MATE family efflux transporter [Candidatus Amulumruptor caecigallinarius]|uniref:Multidrug export protein MepA n=2 Tax=Pseudomonadati TaxID=3379134 RepID=A0A4Q0U8E3_9BACT|nr:MAG: MATE family efflux transporter [Candidatus Amulumruptor caecigallinarius]HJE39432.1 MATE family efflux transporter [Candidatus Amulumruptor caecigallinarius]